MKRKWNACLKRNATVLRRRRKRDMQICFCAFSPPSKCLHMMVYSPPMTLLLLPLHIQNHYVKARKFYIFVHIFLCLLHSECALSLSPSVRLGLHQTIAAFWNALEFGGCFFSCWFYQKWLLSHMLALLLTLSVFFHESRNIMLGISNDCAKWMHFSTSFDIQHLLSMAAKYFLNIENISSEFNYIFPSRNFMQNKESSPFGELYIQKSG